MQPPVKASPLYFPLFGRQGVLSRVRRSDRWSPRKTLLFVVGASLLLWTLILLAIF